ncbi:MAG: carboxymuconolactone decarboxylase family protein [Roseibium sp.]|uniref:carboxymuconolactone decarboxylase family protein n=1 Tax=Roseibium sp. TaxID=1936156 RepID=UPI00261A5B1A|nr:carboxymuconolactone decarboxylase family protein [Roseibium sp.]MCV0428900.1 carboxymuconolactone decarboxylase family protein [Roseibium sp.]
MTSQPARYSVLNLETAPSASAPLLERINSIFGGILPLKGVMANSPVTLKSYLDILGNMNDTDFTKIEQQSIYLVASMYNGCGYCTDAHSRGLKKIFKMPEDQVDAILSGRPTGDEKIDALVNVTQEILETRGAISDEARHRFLQAGYTDNQLIDLLSALAMKLITNYLGRLSGLG